MGPSPPPPSSQLTRSRPSASPPPPPSLPYLISASDDWFLNASDRDTQILTQALTRELSSCTRPPAPACSSSSPSSLLPSPASWSSSSSFYETLSGYLEERPLHSQSFEASWALQQQQQKATAMSRAWPCGDGFSFLEQNPQLKGSPLSNNSSPPLSASAEAPASPFSTSTLSTNSAVSTIATESLFAHLKPNNSQHHGSQDARVARRVASSLKPSAEASSMCSDSSLPSKAASIALSSQASAGAGGCKVNKKRIRSKAPIAVLSADTSNFRAMVQQLTGISSSSSIQSLTHGGLPLLKPQPIRDSFTDNLNLPTLDTSECFLGPKNMKEGFSFAHKPHQISSRVASNLSSFAGVDLSKVEGRNVDNSTLQRHMPAYDKQAVFDDQGNGINHSFSSMLPSRWNSTDSLKFSGNYSSLHDGEQISTKQSMIATSATLDNLLMEEHSAPKSAPNAVESWLSFFDGAHANHASNMEIARMA